MQNKSEIKTIMNDPKLKKTCGLRVTLANICQKFKQLGICISIKKILVSPVDNEVHRPKQL